MDVQCRGYEEKLQECLFSSTDDCSPLEGAGVVCSSAGNVTIQLVGGGSDKEGNVFVYNSHTDYFGPVCDDHWTMTEVGFI